MLILFISICVTGSLAGLAIYGLAVGAINFIEYVKMRQCGLHICWFCDVKNRCSWKSEREEIKNSR